MKTGRGLLRGHTNSFIVDAPVQKALEWLRTVPNNGLIRYYMLGNVERVLVVSPKALGEVLVSKSNDFQKPELTRISLSRITGQGVLVSEGENHRVSKTRVSFPPPSFSCTFFSVGTFPPISLCKLGKPGSKLTVEMQIQRKGLTPAFSYRHVKNLYPLFWYKGIEMVQEIEDDLRKLPESEQVVRIGNYASRTTLDIIGAAGMGRDFGSIKDPNNKLSQTYRSILKPLTLPSKILIMFGVFVIGMKALMKLPTPRQRRIRRAAEFIRVLARRLIREKKSMLENKETNIGVDILSVALTSGVFLTEESLVDQIMTFLAAGHDTTSAALQWSIYALCKYPDIQDRLREEVRANLPPISGDDAQPILASSIDNLTYLNAFCNEILRFFPPVPATLREAICDTTIQDVPIPKGTKLVICPEATNRDPDLWGPDAGEFNPDRWIGPGRANSGGADSNYAFLTFIHGPRSCIGQTFSKSELACLVATMVGRFQFELKDPNAVLEYNRGVTARPKDGVQARTKILDGW